MTHESTAKTRLGTGEALALAMWLLLTIVLVSTSSPAPEAPTVTREQQRTWTRTAAIAQRDAQVWQRTLGDRSLSWGEARGHLAIVIDDVGRELAIHERLQALRYSLTFSILPGGRYTAGAQLRLRSDPRRYREILLHLPMEPDRAEFMREGADAREVFLLHADDDATLQVKLEDALARVPAAIGVNNHMGSRLSADARAMKAVMAVLEDRGLLFLDSRTSAETMAEYEARAAGVPTVRRHVFIDRDPARLAIERSLSDAGQRALAHPTVAIAHPTANVAGVLERGLDRLFEQGIGIFPLSEIVAHHLPPRDTDTGSDANSDLTALGDPP